MPDLSPEAREALKVASNLGIAHILNQSVTRDEQFIDRIAAALLEARAAQIEEMASPAQTLWLDDAKRLRHQAQVLREGSK